MKLSTLHKRRQRKLNRRPKLRFRKIEGNYSRYFDIGTGDSYSVLFVTDKDGNRINVHRGSKKDYNFFCSDSIDALMFAYRSLMGLSHHETIENENGTFTHRTFQNILDAEIVEDILGSEIIE